MERPEAMMMPDKNFGLSKSFMMKKDFSPPTPTKMESPFRNYKPDQPFSMGTRPETPAIMLSKPEMPSFEALRKPTDAPKLERPEGINFVNSDDGF